MDFSDAFINIGTLSSIYLPMIIYIMLQIPVAIIGTIIIKEQKLGISGCLKSWIMGQMLCFAVLQILTVPMILLRWKFNVLFWSYLLVMGLIFCYGVVCFRKKKIILDFHKESWNWFIIVLTIITFALIFWQICNYFFGVHLDEDDARWLVEANDAIEYGEMMIRSPYTGELISKYAMTEDVSSPWPMMYAIASRVLFLRVPIFCHTLYSTVELALMYAIYWLIGLELFQKIEARISFLFCVSFIMVFFGGSVYTQAVFSLARIWQGKATVAAVIIPLILYIFILINKENRLFDWIALIISSCAACLMSGMGIFIAAAMVGVYGLYNIVVYRNWKRILLWCCSLLPSAASYLAHYIITR